LAVFKEDKKETNCVIKFNFSRFIPFFISLQLKGKSKGEGDRAVPRVGSYLVKSLELLSNRDL
jgi:hypothetical protein